MKWITLKSDSQNKIGFICFKESPKPFKMMNNTFYFIL